MLLLFNTISSEKQKFLAKTPFAFQFSTLRKQKYLRPISVRKTNTGANVRKLIFKIQEKPCTFLIISILLQ